VTPVVGQFTTDGQILFGATAAPNARVALPTGAGGVVYNGGEGGGEWDFNASNVDTGILPVEHGGSGSTNAPAGAGIGASNLGVSYNAGTGVFSVTGATAPLSATNPGIVYLQSKATPGLLKKYVLTADQNFIDDAGASQIIGNLFGWTTGVAITVDVPFFIYAVGNDAETGITFMLSRLPHCSISAATIGQPGDTLAAAENDFWSFDTITASEWDQNPCVNIGGIRMRMSVADDWTVQALTTSDGVGRYFEERSFTMPLGQKGAVAGSWSLDNGGTAPIFTDYEVYEYKLTRNGLCVIDLSMNGDGGADGAGAVSALLTSPIMPITSGFNFGPAIIQTPAYNVVGSAQVQSNINFRLATSAAPIQWDAFTNGNRTLRASITFAMAV
jgi:hypothetical protein